MEQNSVVLSIICITYNHEKYIEKTLDSLLNQNIDVPYEIIVHDDASTDRTQEIVLRYATLYPHIIKPILRKENLYSQGIGIVRKIVLENANGKYLAFCEGDDFWTYSNKMSKQLSIMEKDVSVSMCCHATICVDEKENILKKSLHSADNVDGYLEYADCLSVSNFPHFSSMLIRRNDYLAMPEFFYHYPVGDYPLRCYAIAIGKVYYFNEPWSAYRVMSKSSWSKKYIFDMDYKYKSNNDANKFFFAYDDYTNKVYHKYISDLVMEKDYNIAIYTGRFSEAKIMEYNKNAPILKRILIELGIKHPKIAITMIKIRTMIKLAVSR